jgi:site-specific DNA-cytosine methylase
MFHAPWVGWYAAIEDLISSFPKSKFADWFTPFVGDLMSQAKAFLTGKHKNDWGDCVSFFDEPAMTISATSDGRHRIWLPDNRILTPNVRALARFQSVPDVYMLPDRAALACTVIGNMIPPLLMQKVGE